MLRLGVLETDEAGNFTGAQTWEAPLKREALTQARIVAWLGAIDRLLMTKEHEMFSSFDWCLEALEDPQYNSVEEFEAYLRNPPVPPTYFEQTDAEYPEFVQRNRPEPRSVLLQHRAMALEKALARHGVVAARFARTHGLYLPKQAAVTFAFFESLASAEWQAPKSLMGITPSNVAMGFLSHYSEEAFAWPLKEGLDERIHYIWPETVPETPLMFLADFASFAFFYDDPGFHPSGVVHCKMDHQTRWIGETFLDFFRDWADEVLKHPSLHLTGESGVTVQLGLDPEDVRKRDYFLVRMFKEAVDDFLELSKDLRVEDRAKMRRSYEERSRMAGQPGGVGIATDLGDGEGFEFPSGYHFDEARPAVLAAVARARAQLREGDPRYALALGRELHGSCHSLEREVFSPGYQGPPPPWQDEAKELLTGAYRALGWEALARKVEVHHAHRNFFMRSVFDFP
ncbi:hypothetical protein [Myxococcus landrumensis]|uniref:Knr4/Smi1-like domain-containing protein n=1 Tax=Myxococcus landrumensis TaxID=2813577 RepID=A0ABX7MXW9_9BACT|nr:hypothetical protein [Myxococcus landrumus]QSQ11053.1 hypothetical protein JY572_21770 [Myxococcus landrumus]